MEGANDDNSSLRVESFSCYLGTAKASMVQKVSAQHPTTKPPLINSNFSHSNDSKDSLTNLRVDSFSYLNTAGDKFLFNVPAPVQDPTSFTFPQQPRKTGEIGVFGADKYFNMKLDYQTGIKRDSNNERPVNLARGGSNPMPRTPSSCSKASSLNSQTALLPILQRNGSQTKQKKAIGRRFFSGFGCKEPCFGRKVVHINKVAQEAAYYGGSKPTRTGSERIDRLAVVPIANPGTENFKVKQHQKVVANLEESRTSIEVFGSGTNFKGDVAKNLERKLSMLTWDAIPKARTVPSSTVGNGTICDDMVSEASSDLFEIDNISATIHPILATDAMSICMSSPASHNAPSEASIQWSVVTASAADYSASDYNDETSVSVAGDVMARSNNVNNKSAKTRNEGGKEAEKAGMADLWDARAKKQWMLLETCPIK